MYQFDAMPNGYGPAMRIFTKVTKVPFSHLRSKRHISVVYVDDSYLQGSTFDSCRDNVDDTVNLLRSLGFTIHAEKSVLVPQQKLTFLGFEFNSVDMTVSLTSEKREKVHQRCLQLLGYNDVYIRLVAQVIGIRCLLSGSSIWKTFFIVAWRETKLKL